MGQFVSALLDLIGNAANNNQIDEYTKYRNQIDIQNINPDNIPQIEGSWFRDPKIRLGLMETLNKQAELQKILRNTPQDNMLINAAKSLDPVTYDYGNTETLQQQGYLPTDLEDVTPQESQGMDVNSQSFKTNEGQIAYQNLQDYNRNVGIGADANQAMGMPNEQAIAMARAQFTDPAHLASRTGQVEQAYKMQEGSALKANNAAFGSALNDWITQNPQSSIYQQSAAATSFASKYRPDKDVFKTTLEGIKQGAVEYKVHDTGTGKPGQVQSVAYDPFNPSVVQNIGSVKQSFEPKGVNVTVNGDKKGIEGLMTSLPGTQSNAATAIATNKTIDKMISLIDAGAAGAKGYATANIAPALGILGIDTKGMNDAQLYQTYASTIAGGLRQQIVGPGPVSDYEQKLMKSVSGGGAKGASASKELLQHYKQTNQQKINTYNSTLNAIQAIAPETSNAFRQIDIGQEIPNKSNINNKKPTNAGSYLNKFK